MSNFLQVPSVRRDSFKSATWDCVLREKSQDEDETEELTDQTIATSTSDTTGEDFDIIEEIKKEDEKSIIIRLPLTGNEFYLSLLKEAPFIPGDAGELVTFSEIRWMDTSLVQESVDFHKKYYTHEIFAMAMSLIFSFAVKPYSGVLLRNSGYLENPEEFYQRQISMLKGILKFFDFHKNPDEAYDEILKIRQMFNDMVSTKKCGGCIEDLKLDEPWKKEITEAVRKDLAFIDTSKDALRLKNVLTWDPEVPLSQFDMVTLQMGFWVSMWLNPGFFGVKNKSKELQGVIHMWAIFGRLMGIKDEYNVCLKSGASDNLYERIFRHVILQSLKSIDEKVVTLQSTFIDQFSQRLPLVTYKSVLYFGLRQHSGVGYKGNNLWKLMTWKDKLSVRFLQAVFLLMRHSKLFRMLVNYLLYFSIQLQDLLLYWPSKKWKVPIPQYLRNAITLKLY